MLEIECHKCKQRFWVKGYMTPDAFYDPGEVVVHGSETFDECCECLRGGAEYDVTDEEIDRCDDDVI